ncbi:MAG: hypothetical protein V3S39_07285, partial [Thermodesulfobacteriota bacterium]
MGFRLLLASAIVFATAALTYGDVVYFHDLPLGVEGQVTELSQRTITIQFPTSKVKAVVVKASKTSRFTDLVQFKGSVIELKGWLIDFNRKYVTLRVPREKVKEIRMGAAKLARPEKPQAPRSGFLALPELKQENTQLVAKVMDLDEMLAKLRWEMKQEVRKEVAAELQAAKRLTPIRIPAPRKPKEEDGRLAARVKELDQTVSKLRREMKQEVEKEVVKAGVGRLKGRVLWKGRPLPGVKVMILRLRRMGVGESLLSLVGRKGDSKVV